MSSKTTEKTQHSDTGAPVRGDAPDILTIQGSPAILYQSGHECRPALINKTHIMEFRHTGTMFFRPIAFNEELEISQTKVACFGTYRLILVAKEAEELFKAILPPEHTDCRRLPRMHNSMKHALPTGIHGLDRMFDEFLDS